MRCGNSLWCAYPYTLGVVLSAQFQVNGIPEIVAAIVFVAALGRALVSVAMFVTVTVFAVVSVVVVDVVATIVRVVVAAAGVGMWAILWVFLSWPSIWGGLCD